MADTFKTTKKTTSSEDGTLLYYETYTRGAQQPTVFLIHGAGGDLDAWQYVRNGLLESDFPCMAMDIRGHGYSGHPKSPAAYSMDKFTDDIAAILRNEKIDKIFLVGHSFGAAVVLSFALRYPDKLKGLVVISGSYRQPGYLSSKAMTSLATKAMSALSFVSPPPIKPGHSVYPAGKFHKDFEWFGLVKTIMRNSWKSYLLSNREVLTLDIEHRLSSIKVPTLFIAGTADSVFPFEISQNMHQKIAGSKLELISGANHVVVLNNAPEVITFVREFLREQGT